MKTNTIRVFIAYILSTIAGYFICYFIQNHNESILGILSEIAMYPIYIAFYLYVIFQINITLDTSPVVFIVELFIVIVLLTTLVLNIKRKNNVLLGIFSVINTAISYSVYYSIWAVAGV